MFYIKSCSLFFDYFYSKVVVESVKLRILIVASHLVNNLLNFRIIFPVHGVDFNVCDFLRLLDLIYSHFQFVEAATLLVYKI